MHGVEAEVIANADEDRALSHLRHAEPTCIEHAALDVVSAVAKSLQDPLEVSLCGALNEPTDVFGNEDLRLYALEDACIFVKQVVNPLSPVAVGLDLAPAFFALSCRRECGTGWRAVEEV